MMTGWKEVHGVACAVCHRPTDAAGVINHTGDCDHEARMALVHEWRVKRIEALELALTQIKAVKDIGADFRDENGKWFNDAAAERDRMYQHAIEALGLPPGLAETATS